MACGCKKKKAAKIAKTPNRAVVPKGSSRYVVPNKRKR